MSEIKAQQSLENLGKALDRLEEALQQPIKNPLAIDGTIQRFESVRVELTTSRLRFVCYAIELIISGNY